MKFSLLILLALLTQFGFSQTERIQIFEVVVSDAEDSPTLIKAVDSRVFHIDGSLNSQPHAGSFVEIDHTDHKVIRIRLIESASNDLEFPIPKPKPVPPPPPASFKATNFTQESKVVQTFDAMNGNVIGSAQCYQKAHYWANEMHLRSQIQSEKVFLFFTNRYIREYNYKWWYHVSPTVRYKNNLVVMDRFFTRTPSYLRAWTNVFMNNNATCRNMSHFNEYHSYAQTEHCLIRVLSMYYYNPVQMKRLDYYGEKITRWRSSEVNDAYRAVGQ